MMTQAAGGGWFSETEIVSPKTAIPKQIRGSSGHPQIVLDNSDFAWNRDDKLVRMHNAEEFLNVVLIWFVGYLNDKNLLDLIDQLEGVTPDIQTKND
mgnify:CR=1 FL=1